MYLKTFLLPPYAHAKNFTMILSFMIKRRVVDTEVSFEIKSLKLFILESSRFKTNVQYSVEKVSKEL